MSFLGYILLQENNSLKGNKDVIFDMLKRIIILFLISSTIYAERGDLLSFEFVDSVNVDDIDNYLNGEFGDFELSIEYSAIMYSITYETIDQFGNYTVASGMVAFPDENNEAYPLVSFQHGTQIRRESAPSMNGFNALSQAMVTAG